MSIGEVRVSKRVQKNTRPEGAGAQTGPDYTPLKLAAQKYFRGGFDGRLLLLAHVVILLIQPTTHIGPIGGPTRDTKKAKGISTAISLALLYMAG